MSGDDSAAAHYAHDDDSEQQSMKTAKHKLLADEWL